MKRSVWVAGLGWVGLVAMGVEPRGALVVAGLLGLVVLVLGVGGARGGRAAMGHGHGGSSAHIARHEAGHVAAARAVGGRVRSVRADEHGGLTQVTIPDDDVAHVAFLRAGRHAVRSGRGCGDDDAAARRVLRGVPRADRARVERDGDRLARRIVSRHSGQIRRDAETIERTGRL